MAVVTETTCAYCKKPFKIRLYTYESDKARGLKSICDKCTAKLTKRERWNAQTKKGAIMTSRDFCYWLQGYFEVAKPNEISGHQLEAIKAHLNMVFIHEIDPSFPAEQQGALNDAHKPNKPNPS